MAISRKIWQKARAEAPKLVESQGGSDRNEGHAQDNIFQRIAQMGNSTISSNEEMKKLSSSIATICNTVNELKRDMDKTDDTNSDTSSVKRA